MTIDEAVRLKWTTSREKEWWYEKLAAVRRRKLLKLSESQNHRCCYCSRLTWIFDGGRVSSLAGYQADRLPGMSFGALATLEHIIPVSDEGSDHISNLVMACYRCNTLRGNNVSAIQFWETLQDPAKYHQMIVRSREARRRRRYRNSPEREAKRQVKHQLMVVWFAYMATVSPECAKLLGAIEQIAAEELVIKQANLRHRLRFRMADMVIASVVSVETLVW